jgi:starch synthase (maltosyl-transferring)
MTPPIVYNLFPTLVGPLAGWVAHAERAAGMGFDWLYVNPVHYPGFSGSLYAVKDHERLHPLLVPGNGAAPLTALAPVVREVRQRGLAVMLDLVVNHTSRDSVLVERRPAWYRRDAAGRVVSPSAIDPANAERVTVWGDLAEIDNASSPERDELWSYWEGLVGRCLDVGVTGFRCDAAYKVPAALWRRLITTARERVPQALFVAETLGCRLEEVTALGAAGFDYFYNSSKWWDFVEPWALEQHAAFGRIAPSIAFPESHDTARLAAETGGDEAVQRQRYAFAAMFSAGVQLTIGYEFGFRRPLDVVRTSPADWEPPLFDLQPFVRRTNALKRGQPVLGEEGVLRPAPSPGDQVTALSRETADRRHRGLVLVNRDVKASRPASTGAAGVSSGARLFRPCLDDAPADGQAVPGEIHLAPAEVALIVADAGRGAGAAEGAR